MSYTINPSTGNPFGGQGAPRPKTMNPSTGKPFGGQ